MNRRHAIKTIGAGFFLASSGLWLKGAPPFIRARQQVQGRRIVAPASTPSPYLINQNFETPTTGFDNGESWGTTGSVTFNTSSPLAGTQDLKIAQGTNKVTSPTFAAQTNLWIKFMFLSDATTSSTCCPFGLKGISNNDTAYIIYVVTTGNIRLAHGTTFFTTGLNITAGQVYYFWFKYVKGTGSNGVFNFYYSTTSARPANPNAAITNGNGTADSIYFNLGNKSSTAANFRFDAVYASGTELT